MAEDLRLGLIGLGQMGARFARRLAAAGHALAVFDAAGTEKRAPDGATVCASPAAVGACAEVVLLSLPDGPAVEAVAAEIANQPARAVRCVVDHSTIGPEAARAVHAALAAAGIAFLDAPVSGGIRGAEDGTLAMMLAGERAWAARLDDVLGVIASRRFAVGDMPGQGQAMKLLNNMLSGAAMVATAEAVLFGERFGLEPAVMIEVLNASTGRNTATSDKFPNRILSGRYDAGFTVDLIAKDLALYTDAAARAGAGAAVGRLVCETLAAMKRALPGADFTRIYPFLKGEGGER